MNTRFQAASRPAPLMTARKPIAGSGTAGSDHELSDRAQSQMNRLAQVASASATGRHPRGHCYGAVARYIERSGYGRMPQAWPDGRHTHLAKQFGQYANNHLAELGLRKLPIDDPYQAPKGAIVVVNPHTPGTHHPTAGDISVALGNGRFLNDGEMRYGGSHCFPPGNSHVVGIYVPA